VVGGGSGGGSSILLILINGVKIFEFVQIAQIR
jgi:hypothetical protein